MSDAEPDGGKPTPSRKTVPPALSDLSYEVLRNTRTVQALPGGHDNARGRLLALLGVYVFGALLATPLVLFPNVPVGFLGAFNPAYWVRAIGAIPGYLKNMSEAVRLISCTFILLLPILGYRLALQVVGRLADASNAAGRIDTVTASFKDDSSQLHGMFRHELYRKYEQFASERRPGAAVAVAVMDDSLQMAATDRWERVGAIVDSHVPALLRGVNALGGLQRLAVQLGILFTFIGIMIALTTPAFRSSQGVQQIDLGPTIQALQVGFGSSIAGLMASATLILMAGYCRELAQNVLTRLEALANRILNVAKALDTAPNVVNDLNTMRKATARMAEDVGGMKSAFHETMTASIGAMVTLQGELRTVRETQAVYREFADKMRNDDFSRVVRDGVSNGVVRLNSKVEQAIDASLRLSAVAEQLAKLEADRIASYADVQRELRRLRRMIVERPPAAASFRDAISQALHMFWARVFGRGTAIKTGGEPISPPPNRGPHSPPADSLPASEDQAPRPSSKDSAESPPAAPPSPARGQHSRKKGS